MATLSGKADAALVKAAKDAAMANVPMDSSKIYERMSRSNAALTKSTGKAWAGAIKAVGAIGVSLINKAKENKNKPNEAFENQKGSQPKKFKKFEDKDLEIKSNLETEGLQINDKNNATEKGLSIDYNGKDTFSADNRFKANIDLIPKIKSDFQELPGEFNHIDSDGNSSAVTIANTDEFAETLRDQIYSLSENKKKQLKSVDANQDLSKEEISSRKSSILSGAKKEKKRLLSVKERMKTSNTRFAEFNQLLNSQLSEGTINLKASGIYGANNMKFAEALQNKGKPIKDGSKAVQGYNKNGDLVFMYVDKNNKPIKNNGKDITLAEGDVGSLLVQESAKRPIMDGLIDVKQIRRDSKFGFDEIKSKIARGVENEVMDKNTFLDIAFYRSEGTNSSLADTLHNVNYNDNGEPIIEPNGLSEAFISALSNIGNEGYSKQNPHPYDQDGDGDFDKQDYNSEDNYLQLTKKALSGEDLDFSKSLLKQHYQLQAELHFNNAVDVSNASVLSKKSKKTSGVNEKDKKDFPLDMSDTKDITFYMNQVNGYDYDGDGLVDDAPIKK